MPRQATFLILATWLGLCWGAAKLQADFTVVDAQTPACPIVISAEADALTVHLAGKLAAYLKQMTSVEFPIARRPAVRSIELIVEPRAEMPSEGFSWRVTDKGVSIFSRSPRGLAYGVYDFLEQACGCRWWSFNEEEIPQSPALKIENQEVVKWPTFLMHDLFNREAQTTENDFHFKSRGDSEYQFTGGHTLYPLLHDYGKTHPEIYPATAEGKRAPNDLHLCYLAPGIAEALTAALDLEVQRRNGNVTDYIYFAGMGDWYDGQCQCEKCRAVYEEEKWTNSDGTVLPGYTGTLLRMINATAEQLDKKYPGIQVGTFAYMSLEAPPAITKPRKNVVIRVPRLRHCTVHAANECQGNRQFCLNLERWQELAPGCVHVWDYGANFTNFLLPFPTLNSMAENLRYYHKLGIAGVMIQGNYVSTGGDAAVMKNYVWRKLLWEPNRSVKELTEEFCQGYYGPAASDVLAYVNTLENSVRKPELKHADEFASPANVYLNETLLVELRGHLQKALQATAGEQNATFHRRALELQVSTEAAVLWSSGPLEEQAGQLVRTDLGGYTYARALALVKHSRQVSPKEQGEGRLFREQFLQLHGGPIATLAAGDVVAKVAPVQGGKVGPITYQHAIVVADTSMQPAGGASLYEFATPLGGNKLSLRGECGIGHWAPTPRHLAQLHVEMQESGQLILSGEVQSINQGAAKVPVGISTTYPVAPNAAFSIEWQNSAGQWVAVQLTAESPTATCTGLTAIKVKQPKELKTGNQQVTVLDSYSVPNQTKPPELSGALKYDAEHGQLIISIAAEVSDVSSEEPRRYLTRTLTIIAE